MHWTKLVSPKRALSIGDSSSHRQPQATTLVPTAIRLPSAGLSDPDMSAPAPSHRPKPSEYGIPFCLRITLVRIRQLNLITSPRRTGDIRRDFSGSRFVCRTRLSLPQCQVQPQPTDQNRAKYGASSCMHLTFVRSAAQARLNLFGRQSPPLQHPGSAALPIPAKISDSITLQRSFPELIGSMFAGGQKLRRWRLVTNHLSKGYPFKAHWNPRRLIRQ